MRAAFVVVVADADAPIPAHVGRLLECPSAPDVLGLSVFGHVHWRSEDGRTQVAAWQDRLPNERRSWSERDGDIAVVCGQPRRVGAPWRSMAEWPDVIRGLLSDTDRVATESVPVDGIYAGVVARPDGTGIVATDPLALRFLYRSRGAHWTVLASNPHLAALCAVSERGRPRRDLFGVCSLAATGHRALRHSGYEGVEMLRPGSHVELRPGLLPAVMRRDDIWWPGELERASPTDEVVDRAIDAIVENMVAAASFPVDVVTADLTGGKDSRLLVAAAILGNVRDRVEFVTHGPDDLPDVVIASELADRFGLVHHSGRDLARLSREWQGDGEQTEKQPTRWADDIRSYVTMTAGIDNLWQGLTPGAERSQLVLSGLFGEALRSATSWPLHDERHVAEWLDRHQSRLCLLKPDARCAVRSAVLETVLDDPTNGAASCQDLYDWAYIEAECRRNFGPREETKAYHRQVPINALDAVRAAFALGGGARYGEVLHQGILRRAAPALAEHRFTQLPRPDPRRSPPRLRGPKARPPSEWKPRPVKATHQAKSLGIVEGPALHAQQLSLAREIVSQRRNPAWDLIDRKRLGRLLDHYPSMRNSQKLEVTGAMTAALWLADD